MSSKLHINVSLGLIEVEGEESFVREIYKDLIDNGIVKFSPKNPDKDWPPSDVVQEDKPKSRRAAGKRGGPSCAERIGQLISSGFFDQPKNASEIRSGLEQNGHAYGGNQVGAALTQMYKRSELRRFKGEKGWMYQKP